MITSDEALAMLRAKLTEPAPHPEGYGEVTFTRTDGQTVVVDNVRVDSIGPGAMNNGVIGAETFAGDVVHVPFVASWTVDYRF